jgi:hypothetical protein
VIDLEEDDLARRFAQAQRALRGSVDRYPSGEYYANGKPIRRAPAIREARRPQLRIRAAELDCHRAVAFDAHDLLDATAGDHGRPGHLY